MESVLNFAPSVGGTMKLTIPKLRDKVWKYFSKYIRLRDAKGKDFFNCITCEAPVMWYSGNAGHFQHGKNTKTYFMEDNVHGQCTNCNFYNSGREMEYTLKMIDMYGRDRVEEIIEQNHIKCIWTREELEEKLEFYKLKVKELDG